LKHPLLNDVFCNSTTPHTFLANKIDHSVSYIQTHVAEFVVFCIGRFSGVPNIPTFPPGKGPDAFDGQVIHTMDYSKMGTKKANEMLKGKRVTVIGYLKSALDVAAECAELNGTNSYYQNNIFHAKI
jgi:dimethylaniline monooxygenase (N-oxide forming)